MSIYRRKIKVKKEVVNLDGSSLINSLKENIKVVSVLVATLVIVVAGISFARYNANNSSVELSDRLYEDFTPKEVNLDSINDYLSEYKGNTADMGMISLAAAYYESGKYDNALTVYQDVVKSAKEPLFKVLGYLGEGYSLQRLDKDKEAVDAFKLAFDNAGEAISFAPYKVAARVSIGISYEVLGNKKQALTHYKWVRDTFPNSQFVPPMFAQKIELLEGAS